LLILAFPSDLTCIVCPAQNYWDKILKLIPELVRAVHNPIQLVSLTLDTPGICYDFFTQNTFLRLVNRTSQIPYLPQGLSTNVRWPISWNFYHRYLNNVYEYTPDFRVWNITEKKFIAKILWWLNSRWFHNLILHSLYLRKYKASRDEMWTPCNLICIINTLQDVPSKTL